MTNRLRRMIVWLRRIAYCRGFGIQSPWAYAFVRYVINQHNPYYAYDKLKAKYAGCSLTDRRKAKFLFRLANYVQPHEVIAVGAADNFAKMTNTYMKAGCHKLRILRAETSATAIKYMTGSNQNRILLIDMKKMSDESELISLSKTVSSGDYIFADNISSDKNAKHKWTLLTEQPYSTLSFDMYYCGVVYSDAKRHKQNYIINF